MRSGAFITRSRRIFSGVKGSDVTISKNDGISAWPTIVTIAESPKQPGVYYAGTDDGNVQMSRDGGKTWTNVTNRLPSFPAGAFVSEVVPSRFDAATVYVTVDNHRLGDFATHIWVSKDFGATFSSLNSNLSAEAVKTITEDQKNGDVLYIGTETGMFVSLNRGQNWMRLSGVKLILGLKPPMPRRTASSCEVCTAVLMALATPWLLANRSSSGDHSPPAPCRSAA